MAKVPFSKLQATIKDTTVKCACQNKNNETVEFEVKTYLPLEKKLEVISNIVNLSIDDNGFYNPMKVKLFMTLEIIYAYTNLSFTDKMKEDPFKLYDIVVSTGIYNSIIEIIQDEYLIIEKDVYDSIENIYNYKNSILGILEAITTDYSDLNLDALQLQENLTTGNGIELLQQIITKLG